MDALNFAPDLDSSSVEALRDFCAAVLGQNKHLMFARLKSSAQQVLNRAAIPGLPMAALCALSVDDAVNVAQELYPTGSSAQLIDIRLNENGSGDASGKDPI